MTGHDAPKYAIAVIEADVENAVFIPHEQVKAEWAVKRAVLKARI